MEQHSIAQLQLLHPSIRDKAATAYFEAVKATPALVHPYIDQTYRTFEESAKLYTQGRTAPGEIVTQAKAGQSYHNYGLALDFHLQISGKDSWDVDHNWMVVVKIFKSHGFAWGGDWKTFKDYPHFEMRCGYTWQQLLAKHKAGDFIPGTTYVRI